MNVQLGATVDFVRVLVDDSRELGVFADGVGTSMTASDVVLRNTRPRGCVETTCAESGLGNDVGSYDGATVSIRRFVVAHAALCGVQLSGGGEVDLLDGEVRDSTIGVCLQVEGYDTNRLSNGVRFVGNGINLEATTLPVPGLADAVP